MITEPEWFYYGAYRMFVVGYTAGGAPYGTIEHVGTGQEMPELDSSDDDPF